jgi:hypothetical protein
VASSLVHCHLVALTPRFRSAWDHGQKAGLQRLAFSLGSKETAARSKTEDRRVMAYDEVPLEITAELADLARIRHAKFPAVRGDPLVG